MIPMRYRLASLSLMPLLLAPLAPLAAAEPPRASWTDKASLSLLAMGGNAQSQSFGFSNEFACKWGAASALTANLGAVRVSTTTTDYSATGTSPSDFVLTRTEKTTTTSEDYLANLRYDHTLSERFLWFTGAGWERNLPSGIRSRTLGNAGFGYWFAKTDRRVLRTDLGLGYTQEKPVFPKADQPEGFGTWNAVVTFEQKVGAGSAFSSNLTFTDSLKESRNYLAVWRNDLSSSLNKTLALKVGYAMTYNNRPAYRAVDILTPAGAAAGQTSVALKKLDTVFAASLVVTF
jgi:putative salt-induced outer membrane protein YdiY